MDILIKGMELPKSCYSDEFKYCPFLFFDYDTKSHCELSDGIRCLKTKRPKDCPLIEVEEAKTGVVYPAKSKMWVEAST